MGLFILQLVLFRREKKVSWKFIPFWDILCGSLRMKEKKLEYKMMWQRKGKWEKKGRAK